MPVHLLGINHRTAPVEIRESVVFEPDALARALPDLLRLHGVSEAVIVSTCNRTEIYAEIEGAAAARLGDWLARWHRLGDDVRRCFYALDSGRAARHLFAVACGLDSVVLGEPQILGQLKLAYRAGEDQRSVGPALSRLFQQAFGVAKQVRSETGIGASPVSVAYAAVVLARKLFGGFAQHTALLVGAGDTVELAARHLHRQGVRKLVIANRSLARAADLAARFNGVATSLAELDERLPEADLVITATRATEPVISYAQVQEALRLRRRRPMCIVDVGVPRDVDARVATLEDAYLYTVDDLETVIEEGWRSRRQAAAQAEQIIDFAVEQYERLLRTLDAVPTIRALRGDTERQRDEALSQARRQLQAGRDAEEVLEQLAHALTQKFLHAPSIRLRAAAEDTDTDLIAAATELFGLAERPERDG
jgi:glutamyl-tRNA reductase